MSARIIIPVLLILLSSAGSAFGKVVTETIPYKQGDVALEGFLAYDDAIEGKRPGILVAHEWWGLNEYIRQRVKQLARMGYVAFAVDLYGKGKVTDHPDEAKQWMEQVAKNEENWRQRALAGLEELKKHRFTEPGLIAAIGYCFGGSTVQQLAYAGTDLKGVVSFHGSLVMPPKEVSSSVPARMLILHGAADSMVDMKTIPGYMTAMDKSGIDWQLVIYGGAKHSFTNPNADKMNMDGLAYNESADHRSWGHMKLFFEEIFKD